MFGLQELLLAGQVVAKSVLEREILPLDWSKLLAQFEELVGYALGQWVAPDSDDFELALGASFEVEATGESAKEGLREAVREYDFA